MSHLACLRSSDVQWFFQISTDLFEVLGLDVSHSLPSPHLLLSASQSILKSEWENGCNLFAVRLCCARNGINSIFWGSIWSFRLTQQQLVFVCALLWYPSKSCCCDLEFFSNLQVSGGVRSFKLTQKRLFKCLLLQRRIFTWLENWQRNISTQSVMS